MKSAALLVHLISAIAFVSAVPASYFNSFVINRSNAAGAAYFITNEPSGNFIMVASIASNGVVTYENAVSTNGRGAHATGGTGPDPLMSQGAVKTSAAAKVVAAVNAGSNTVSLFSINAQDPTRITPLGAPVSSEGEFPVSIAINKKGTQACVLNAGLVNGVNCYTIDKTLGLIRQPNTLRSLNLQSDSGPSAAAAHHVAFNDANDKLIVTVVGPPGFLAIWDVAADGTLSENFTTVAPPGGATGPFSLTAVPGTSSMVSADINSGLDVWDLSSITSAATGGNLTAPGRSSNLPIPGQMATCWSAFSPNTGNFYLVDAGASMVTEFNLDQNMTATVVKQYPQRTGSTTLDGEVATINGKDFLYVLGAGSTSIDVLSLHGPGNAQTISSVSFASKARSLGVTINANNVQGMATFVKV